MNNYIYSRRNLSAPLTVAGDMERCKTFDTNWTRVLETLTPPPAGTPMVPCQHGWEFEFSNIPYETVVSEVSCHLFCCSSTFLTASSARTLVYLAGISDVTGRSKFD